MTMQSTDSSSVDLRINEDHCIFRIEIYRDSDVLMTSKDMRNGMRCSLSLPNNSTAFDGHISSMVRGVSPVSHSHADLNLLVDNLEQQARADFDGIILSELMLLVRPKLNSLMMIYGSHYGIDGGEV